MNTYIYIFVRYKKASCTWELQEKGAMAFRT